MLVLDIGSNKIKLVKGSSNKKGIITISDCYIEDTPAGFVNNGYIKNVSDFSFLIRNIVKNNKLNRNRCCATLVSPDIIAKEINVPVIKNKFLYKIIKNEIANTFGDSNEYFVDYSILGKEVVDYRNVYILMAYAVPKVIVQDYYDLIVNSGLKPSVLDVHSNSIYKIVKNGTLINNDSINDKVIIMVDIGGAFININLFIDGKNIYKKSSSIIDELNNEKLELVSDFSEFEEDEKDTTFDIFEKEDYSYFEDNSQTNPLFSKISEEIYKMVQFTISRTGRRAVDKIFLYGGNSRIEELEEYLTDSLEIKSEKIKNVSNIINKTDADICDIFTAAGSLIRLWGYLKWKNWKWT